MNIPNRVAIGCLALLVLVGTCLFGTLVVGFIYNFTQNRTAPVTAPTAAPTVTAMPPPSEVVPTAQPTAVPTEVPVQEPTQEPAPVETGGDWPSDLFRTPVRCEKSFSPASAWLICEPGVLLDNTTAWTIPSTKATWFSNVPEGGFAYYSLGQGKITVDGYTINLPYIEGHNYIVLVRGRIDDGVVDTDRNLTAELSDFVPGHAIYSYMPKGAYVSYDWVWQQLVASTTESFTNCGGLGCSHDTVVLFDVDTHFEQRFGVTAGALDDWTQVH